MSNAISAPINRFLHRSLPGDGTDTHILALGELHHHDDHIRYLRDHLPRLIRRHRIGTIGIESPILVNVLFYAYAQGKLPVPPHEARDYLKAMTRAICREDFHANRDAVIDLMCDAMELGVKPVAFDTRRPFEDLDAGFIDWGRIFELRLVADAADLGIDPEDARMRIRIDPAFRDGFFERQYINPQERHFWAKNETITLMHAHPEFYQYIRAIQHICLTLPLHGFSAPVPDYLSATTFRACAVPGKNALTISGSQHVSRIAEAGRRTDGYFSDYLGSVLLPGHAKPTVTTAMLAGVGMREDSKRYEKINRDCWRNGSPGKPVAGHIIPGGQPFTIERPSVILDLNAMQLPAIDTLKPHFDTLQKPWDIYVKPQPAQPQR